MEKYNYKNSDEVIVDYAKCSLNKENKYDSNKENDSSMFSYTPYNKYLEENPPNIVFLQMESMSSYFFELHSSEFNMLGSLEDELKKCIVFKNFVSCRDMTIFSMDGLIVNSPISPLSQSRFLNTSFPTSNIMPFKAKGYDTEFITGGRSNWRNLDQFLPRQGFDKLEDGADIVKHCKNALEEHEWGVYDEFLMTRIIQRLKEKKDKPVFIYGVSISYHTPYKPPSNYREMPVAFNNKLKVLLKSTDEKTRQSFICYQYMCNCLGNFLKEISNTSLAENTIVIVTGDHSSHISDNLFNFSDKNFMKRYGVPLIFYLPERLKKNITINTERFGSHKDIFPTIFNLAFSKTKYYNCGNYLFSNDTTTNYFGLYEYYAAINKYGRSKINKYGATYYNWSEKIGGDIKLVDSPSSELIKLGNIARSYSAYNILYTIKQIATKNNVIKNTNPVFTSRKTKTQL